MRVFQLLSLAALGACAANPLHKRSACPPKSSSTSISTPTSTTTTSSSTTTISVPATGLPSCPSGSTNPDDSFAIISTNPGSNQGKYLCAVPQGSGYSLEYTVAYSSGPISHDFTPTSDVCYYNTDSDDYFAIDYQPTLGGIPYGYSAYQGSPFYFQAFNYGEANSLRCSVKDGYLYCDLWTSVPYPGVLQPGYISEKDGYQVVPYCT